MVEVNSETDFVARNEEFQAFARTLAGLVLEHGTDIDGLQSVAYPETGRTVGEQLTHNIATIGENMSIRRAEVVEVPEGTVVSYVHSAVAAGLGKIGVLVGVKSSASGEALETLGKQVAMHVAATAPQSLSVDDLDPTSVDRERQVLIDQAKASGKPDEIVEKMVEGRIASSIRKSSCWSRPS